MNEVYGSPIGQNLEHQYAEDPAATYAETGPAYQEPQAYASLGSLLAPIEQAPTKDVRLPDGQVVKVRGLTRQELLDAAEGTESNTLIEARTVSAGMVQPRLSAAQVSQWQKSVGSVQALAAVTNAIRDLSGLGKGADKSDLDEAGD